MLPHDLATLTAKQVASCVAYHAALPLAEIRRRQDSLRYGTSFVVMQGANIIEALTADHHFEQAGFVALLK